MSSRLLRTPPRLTNDTVRLFCIPYAGGSANIYNQWQDSAPSWLQICPIELPGRGWLGSIPPLKSLIGLADAIASAIGPYTNNFYAVFGHSMGALLAYEVILRLEAMSKFLPRRLFASASRAPFVPSQAPSVSHLSDIDFLHYLGEMEGTPKNVLQQTELMQVLLPVLRADFSLAESYLVKDLHRLQTPITALIGTLDKYASEKEMQLWTEVTTGAFRSVCFSGGHFFLNEQAPKMICAICEDLESCRDSKTQSSGSS
jgi:medium-chain acyl-[acyl-carrier-protein] hydrolase